MANAEKRNAMVAQHPCFSYEAHKKCGRIHLPVSPDCNMQCSFCKRSFNKKDCHPGVSQALITPEESLGIVEKAMQFCPEITAVSIAGPGDTLASDHALLTLRLIHERFPGLIKSISTNGLILKEKAQGLASAGVKAVTVSMNALNTKVVEKICTYIFYNGRYITGENAARWLILGQLAGIAECAKIGVTVKIDAVLIPGVNDRDIIEVAKVASEIGASHINIVPLIPQHNLKNHRAPDWTELNAVRDKAAKYLDVIRHCRQCRSDACGIPESNVDFANKLYNWADAVTVCNQASGQKVR